MSLGRFPDDRDYIMQRAHALIAVEAWLYEQKHPPPKEEPPGPSEFEWHLALMGAPAFALPATRGQT